MFTLLIDFVHNLSIQEYRSYKFAHDNENAEDPIDWASVSKLRDFKCCKRKDCDGMPVPCLSNIDKKAMMAIRLQLYTKATGERRNMTDVSRLKESSHAEQSYMVLHCFLCFKHLLTSIELLFRSVRY